MWRKDKIATRTKRALRVPSLPQWDYYLTFREGGTVTCRDKCKQFLACVAGAKRGGGGGGRKGKGKGAPALRAYVFA